MTEQQDRKLQSLADSATLRVLQYLVTVVMVPAMLWSVSNVMARLDRIETAINAGNTLDATVELRLANVEDQQTSANQQRDALKVTTIDHEYRVKRLEEIQPQARIR